MTRQWIKNKYMNHTFVDGELFRFNTTEEMLSEHSRMQRAARANKQKVSFRLDKEINCVLALIGHKGLSFNTATDDSHERATKLAEDVIEQLEKYGSWFCVYCTNYETAFIKSHIIELLSSKGLYGKYLVTIGTGYSVKAFRSDFGSVLEQFEEPASRIKAFGNTHVKSDLIKGFGLETCEQVLTELSGEDVKIRTSRWSKKDVFYIAETKKLRSDDIVVSTKNI